jgi:TonB-dependent receptor
VLPSIDFDADLRPNLKFRASYGESIGRPSWDAIQGGQTLDGLARFDGGTGAQGNPALKPLKSKNVDLSLEFYYAKGSYAALGFFEKRIANYVGNEIVRESPFGLRTPAEGLWYREAITTGGCAAGDNTCIRTYIFDTYDGQFGVNRTTGIIPGQPGDPVMSFRITRPANKEKASLRGLEFNLQHLFAGTGFGASLNYTYVTSDLKYNNAGFGQQFALVGLSDTANVVAFYEAANWQVRVAYNWRDGFLASVFDGGGPNPVYFEPYKQVDVSASYDINKQFTVSIEGINLNDAYQRAHGRNERQLVGVSQTGPRYMIGARYKF